MLIRLLCVYEMIKHVCKISHLNSKRLLRKLQKILGGYFILPHPVVTGNRIAAKPQTADIQFTHSPKISIFAPQGRLFVPIHVKFGTEEGTVGPLSRAKFSANQCTGVGMRPQS